MSPISYNVCNNDRREHLSCKNQFVRLSRRTTDLNQNQITHIIIVQNLYGYIDENFDKFTVQSFSVERLKFLNLILTRGYDYKTNALKNRYNNYYTGEFFFDN